MRAKICGGCLLYKKNRIKILLTRVQEKRATCKNVYQFELKCSCIPMTVLFPSTGLLNKGGME